VTPSGTFAYQLKPDKLVFEATSFDWLVLDASRATLHGTGTMNGAGQFSFQLTVEDGGKGHQPDALRMTIWDTTTGAVVYDTQPGAPLDADPATSLGGGSIVIHTEH
jgi:hypothetical protein